ncbi:uncharacterized protein LOC143275875 isoform X1 [Babylonia areolata]|uniref:uncharacterized protein LOC143275875 isoform X1 n=2 Tax=Babylonia areolata TaxID=304850 RepID=UPI003FD1F54C
MNALSRTKRSVVFKREREDGRPRVATIPNLQERRGGTNPGLTHRQYHKHQNDGATPVSHCSTGRAVKMVASKGKKKAAAAAGNSAAAGDSAAAAKAPKAKKAAPKKKAGGVKKTAKGKKGGAKKAAKKAAKKK